MRSKQKQYVISAFALLVLIIIGLSGWWLLADRNQSGEVVGDVSGPPAPLLPTLIATPQSANDGVSGSETSGPQATPAIIGDLEGGAGSLGIDLTAPPTLSELLALYPQLADLLANLDLTDEERMRQVYRELLFLYEKEGLEGLHTFMLASGILEALNLDSAYIDLVLVYEEGGVDAVAELAEERGLLTANDEVRLVLLLDTEDLSKVEPSLTAMGLVIIDHYGPEVEVGLPLAELETYASSEEALAQLVRLAHLPHVIGVRLPEDRRLGFFFVPGEGLGVVGAEAWHRAGFAGAGIKVGIIDPDGFGGFLPLVGSSLPPASRIFIPDWQDATVLSRNTGVHGTACAEIVHGMAPEAELYLVHAANGRTEARAVDWLLANGVHIISYSAGSIIEPTNGTSRSVQLAQKAIDQGVLYVNSAGNYAKSHLAMTFTDTDGDGWHEFPNGEEILLIASSREVSLGLRWDDVWNGASENYDLHLWRERSEGTLEKVAIAGNPQNGRASDSPFELLNINLAAEERYYVSIRAANISRPGVFHLLGYGTTFAYSMAAGSLSSPADGAHVLAVGATYWRDDSLESYSSQGPTSDGRVKPDIAAPARVSNVSYTVFSGTSASTPHVAGAAALVMQAYPSASAAEVRDYLLRHALDKGTAGTDNQYGAGRLAMPSPPIAGATVPPDSGAATAVIHQISTHHNVDVAGIKGMRLLVNFDVDHLQGRTGRLIATFYDKSSGQALRDRNGRYTDNAGRVAVTLNFTPSYERTRYTGAELFMPYSEMELGAGEYELYFVATIVDNAGGSLAQSRPGHFHFNNQGTGRPQAQIRTVRVVHNVTTNGMSGMTIFVSFNITNYRDQTGEVAAYFYFDDANNRPLRDFNGQYTTNGGNVAVARRFTPGYHDARYDEFSIFMPYRELHMEAGYFHRLKFHLIVWDINNSTQLNQSAWTPFWLDLR
jgi:subtilisin family serine protease